MERKIIINECGVCPYIDQNRRLGRVALKLKNSNTEHLGLITKIPVCGKTSKALSYTEVATGEKTIAQATGEIPRWCPLDMNA
ncbi:MAG: hypothetical protein GY751_08175 [Bacteroidetes bacterium]|nr:hypothetical protein [Bacteroidota bacterium]